MVIDVVDKTEGQMGIFTGIYHHHLASKSVREWKRQNHLGYLL